MIGDIKAGRYICATLTLLILIFMISCGSYKSIQSIGESAIKKDPPLEKKYQKIIIQKFETDPHREKDYPDVIIACESTAINELLRKSSILQIEKTRFSSSHEIGAVIIKTRVNTLRIIGINASSRSGQLAGNSEMAVDLKFIDAATGQTIREKHLSTANNAHAPHEMETNSDRNLPYNLGKIIAEYIIEVVRSESY
jgi:hypothetical protein